VHEVGVSRSSLLLAELLSKERGRRMLELVHDVLEGLQRTGGVAQPTAGVAAELGRGW
jgi:hypothetical protein